MSPSHPFSRSAVPRRIPLHAVILLLSVLGFAPAVRAQPPLRGELARLGFMVGEWSGTGWVRYEPDGPTRAARVVARGQPRLAGVVLAWTSTATSTGPDAAVVMSSDLGVRFRADSSAFRATVHQPSGSVEGWVRAGPCGMEWGYTSPSGVQALFQFSSRVEGARRVETGERSPDGGRTWWAFYGAEMAGPAIGGCEASAQPPAGAAPQGAP